MRHSILSLALATTLFMPMKTVLAQAGTQTPQTFKTKIIQTASLKYLLYLPADYSPKGKTRWPLMLFLHGAGERGTNLNAVAVHGPPMLIKKGTNFPFIVVSPQCPNEERWQEDVLMELVDALCHKYPVDTNRLYLTGLSMGGFGSWRLAAKYPERFAAVAPICGGGDVIDILLTSKKKSAAIQSLGIWAFHGAKDPVVPLAESERMVSAFRKAKCAEVELTVYPETGHDSWIAAYNDPKLWDWFQQHSRKK
jgi:predicted peptidase